jgi:hypothetical protein
MNSGSHLVLVLCGLLSACTRHSGDGELTDRGPFAYSRRYTVDLGVIDLGNAASAKYRLTGLPEGEFIVGVEISGLAPLDSGTDNRLATSANLAVEVRDSQGKVYVAEASPLRSWVDSGAIRDTKGFFYQAGTRFTSTGGDYTLLLKVEPNGGLPLTGRVLVHGY